MRRLLPLLLLAGACNPPHPSDVPLSGPPTTDAPEVLAMSLVRPDLTPSPTTTEPVVVPATAAPPVVVTEPEPVVPLTTSPPVVATTAPARSGSCGGWEGLVAAYFPADQVAKGCAVLMCESQGNPNAVSPTNDHGLWQINQVHRNSFDWSRRYDPDVNTAFARKLWGQQGWEPWTCA